MNILITGAFGGVGSVSIEEGHKKGHNITVFELKNERNIKKAEKYKNKIKKVIWGDLTKKEHVKNAIKGQDVVIHLAAVIPPMSEKNVALSNNVNINGTQNIIDAIAEDNNRVKLVFTSSASVMGDTQQKEPPVKVDDPVQVTCHYAEQKIECEKRLKESNITWVTTRLGAVMNLVGVPGGGSQADLMDEAFRISLHSRMEIVIDVDVATALINAAELIFKTNEIDHKTFFIGGGKKNNCQLIAKDYFQQLYDAMGIGMLDEKCFSKEPYMIDWLDTEESQKYLQFQNHTFEDFVDSKRNELGFKRVFIKLIAPIVRKKLEKMSPYLED